MKYLIVGLGNPGEKYENTRHNVGFKVLEELIKDTATQFEVAKLGNVAEHKFKGRTLILLQPSTYMNLSGKAVNYWMQQEKIPLENLLVITDDLALPMGKLRLKSKGSDGGHNGLTDIEAVLRTQHYSRLRFGVGSEFAKGKQVDYVLGEWSPEEIPVLKERMKVATEIIKSFVTIGVDKTMSLWNNK
jgi:peptidyl-tRNA hydrolase, PTH1 family